MKPIAILGCGPAGLIAALAVAHAGHPLAIFSKPGKSMIGGAQFLHSAIPEVTKDEDCRYVQVKVQGTKAGYRGKVYGAESVPFVSFPDGGFSIPAWPLITTYERLWNTFGHLVNDTNINSEWISRISLEFKGIVSSVPLPALCEMKSSHIFETKKIFIHPECFDPTLVDNTVLYDGTKDRSWYRTSKLFGVGGTEWSDLSPRPPGLKPMYIDHKPIRTTCDCWPEIKRVGRRGRWEKGVLSDSAYKDTEEYIGTL